MGAGADDPETEGWVSVLHQQAARRAPSSIAWAFRGSTVADALRARFPVAEAARPRLVTVWLAVNDFGYDVPLDDYRRHSSEMVSRMTATGATVFVGNMPELTGMPEFADRPS